jgi:LuxR family maltose regulon positive regulatory protein
MQQAGSQQMLQRIEQANLFVVSLDNRRQWYRYHALFTQALRYQLERRHADLIPLLHHRASIWYAEQHQTTPAILHALHAQAWQWAADLIEQAHLPLMSFRWGGIAHELARLQEWIEQLPAEVIRSRPQLYLICTQILWQVAPPRLLQVWLDAAQEALSAPLISQTSETISEPMLFSQAQQDQKNLRGMVIAFRTLLRCYEADGEVALSLCQQALALLSAENSIGHIQVFMVQFIAYYTSSANDVVAAIESALQAVSLAQAIGQTSLVITMLFSNAVYLLRAGQLHEAERLAQQAIDLGTMSPLVCWATLPQADLLREWNQLDRALSLAEEAIPLCKQIGSISSLIYLHYGYEVLMRIYLSRGELDAACSAIQEAERISMNLNESTSLFVRSFSFMSDQVRLWLACGELEQATRWAGEREVIKLHDTPFGQERGEVAHARILLAVDQAHLALQRLSPVLQRATAGQRWGHVIETRLLQALAHQMLQEEVQALDALSEAVRLAEPEGYIRSFVDEGAPMESLLYRLRKRNRKHGPTPYLDTLLVAFQQERKAYARAGEPTKAQSLPQPLSERELEVLQLLARGASNLDIAQDLVIAVNTVKRHVKQILSKLGVQNRFQAAKQAEVLGLLEEDL